jgi:lipopolysaccharide export system protein LptC
MPTISQPKSADLQEWRSSKDSDALMPIEVDHSVSIGRLAQQANAWRKRSLQIARLRLLFPGMIIGIVILILGWMVIQSLLNSMNVYQAATDEIRMTNPLYMDRGDKGNRFELRGVEAIRRGRNSSVIALTAPRLEMRSENERQSNIEAASGIYNDAEKTFSIKKDVVLKSGTGFKLKTSNANIDLRSSTVSGPSPVEGEWPGGKLSAQSFRIEDNGNRIIFSGKGEAQVTGMLSSDTQTTNERPSPNVVKTP